MNSDAYKIHGFTTRLVLGSNSWSCESLRNITVSLPTDDAVNIKEAWLEGWDDADTLFVEGRVSFLTNVEWIKWYMDNLANEHHDDNGLYLAVIG